jgi:hypothetical protein
VRDPRLSFLGSGRGRCFVSRNRNTGCNKGPEFFRHVARTACDDHVGAGKRVFNRQLHRSCFELRWAQVANSKVQPALARNAALQRFGDVKLLDWRLNRPDNFGIPLILYELAQSPVLEVGTDSFAKSAEHALAPFVHSGMLYLSPCTRHTAVFVLSYESEENILSIKRISEARQAGHHHRRVQNIGCADHEVGSRGKSGREPVNRLLCLAYSADSYGQSVTPPLPSKKLYVRAPRGHCGPFLPARIADANAYSGSCPAAPQMELRR